MNLDPSPERESKSGDQRWLFAACGVLAGCAVATLCVLAALSIVFLNRGLASDKEDSIYPETQVQLTVGEDHCTVSRTESKGEDPMSSLTWVITDLEGNIVLERNAEGEQVYRYYRAGDYRVSMKGWVQGRYDQISNEVAIHCR